MSLIQPDDNQQPIAPAINHVRQIPATSVNLTDPDAEGTRVLTIDTPMPDSFVIIVPEQLADYLKDKLNGGVILAKPGDVPAPPPESKS